MATLLCALAMEVKCCVLGSVPRCEGGTFVCEGGSYSWKHGISRSKLVQCFFRTEKRAKFDNGEDPLDPEQQQGGNPWQNGGFPFGDGFQFKFHFN